MQRIDAHQHYWMVARGDYGWFGPQVAKIVRDWGPADLRPHLDTAGIARTVLVQAAPTLAETEFLLGIAAREETVAGVVGWVDLRAPDTTATLERLAGNPKFLGIRPMLQDIADTFDVLDPACIATLSILPELGLTFDALVQPRHLPVIAALADRLPNLAIVVDHAAKPFIAAGAMEPWKSDIGALALRPNVWAKLSGMVTEAGAGWTADMLRPYAAHLLEVFGPERIMFGSDWPVLELASSYEEWLALAEEFVAHLSQPGRDAVFGGTAAAFYRIPR